MGRNAFQIPMTNGKVIFYFFPWPRLVSISSLKIAFMKRNKKCESNTLTNTHLIFLNLENRNIMIELHAKIPKLNDKKNTDIVVKMLQENDLTPKATSILC